MAAVKANGVTVSVIYSIEDDLNSPSGPTDRGLRRLIQIRTPTYLHPKMLNILWPPLRCSPAVGAIMISRVTGNMNIY